MQSRRHLECLALNGYPLVKLQQIGLPSASLYRLRSIAHFNSLLELRKCSLAKLMNGSKGPRGKMHLLYVRPRTVPPFELHDVGAAFVLQLGDALLDQSYLCLSPRAFNDAFLPDQNCAETRCKRPIDPPASKLTINLSGSRLLSTPRCPISDGCEI